MWPFSKKSKRAEPDGLRQRRANREAKRRERRFTKERRPTGNRTQRRVHDYLDEFRAACAAGDWENAPMGWWYHVRNNYTAEMISWLEAHPGFVPPHGTHIGPHGTEPWRPEVRCECGDTHFWDSDEHREHTGRQARDPRAGARKLARMLDSYQTSA